MSWRDDYREGSFRGVPFLVEAVDGEIGRRTVVHEFPKRDRAATEDMGRRARRFRFEALVVGPEYFGDRDRLRAALEQPGVGELIHPYWGRHRVAVDGPIRVRESTREGGVATFALTFVEDGGERVRVTTDTSRQLIDAVGLELPLASIDDDLGEPALAALISSFENRFDVTGTSPDLRAAIVARLDQVSGTLRKIRTGPAVIGTAISRELDPYLSFAAEAGALIGQTRSLAGGMMGLLALLFRSAREAARGPGLIPFDEPPLPAGRIAPTLETALAALPARISEGAAESEQVRRQLELEDALAELTQAGVVLAAADASARATFESWDQARRLRTVIESEFERLLLGTRDDRLYGRLLGVRDAVAAHLERAAGELPRVVSFVPPRTTPALVLAHRLYGDPTRDGELVARNPHIRNPALVPGGIPMEVLSG